MLNGKTLLARDQFIVQKTNKASEISEWLCYKINELMYYVINVLQVLYYKVMNYNMFR